MSNPAVFLDRDGTLVHPRHYPSRPEQLVLYSGIGAPLRALQDAGFLLVVITNQSGLARGLFTEVDLTGMHRYLRAELAREGALLDAIYYCPHHVEGTVPGWAVPCTCRKPQPGMLLRAASDLDIDLSTSWFVGDILDDVEAGNRAGTRTVLVDIGTESVPAGRLRTPHFVARDTVHALELIRAVEGLGPEVEVGYIPARWDEAGRARGRG